MFATGVTMGLAEWIIDDTCLVSIYLGDSKRVSLEIRHIWNIFLASTRLNLFPLSM